MNKIILTGRLTKDVEVRATANMTQYSPFTLAVERTYKSQDGSRQADFINCISCGKIRIFRNKKQKQARIKQRSTSANSIGKKPNTR